MKEVKISASEYARMQRDLAKLAALEAGGVDNWDWYDESLTEWRKDNEIDELIDLTIDDFNDLLVHADVDEPAGRGCGYAIIVDEGALSGLLLTFADKYVEIKTGEQET